MADLGLGPDAPVVVNEKGAGQSHLKYRFDLADGRAMFRMCEVLAQGAEKYGDNNWRGISIEDHLNHLITHAYAYLSGDRSDFHLSHIMCRALFAQAVEEQEVHEEVWGRGPNEADKNWYLMKNDETMVHWTIQGGPDKSGGPPPRVKHYDG
jgi:hypothetical protein